VNCLIHTTFNTRFVLLKHLSSNRVLSYDVRVGWGNNQGFAAGKSQRPKPVGKAEGSEGGEGVSQA
jgi:hypothetical protein